jgi:hypothetical protein
LIKQSFYFLRGVPRLTRIEGDHLATKIHARITGIYNYYSASIFHNNFGITFRNKHEEMYSCLCILFIDDAKVEAKIVHIGRGKFKILTDCNGGKYTHRVVDASDIILCRV